MEWSALNGTSVSSYLPRLRDHCGKGDRKMVRARGDEYQGIISSRSSTYELIVTACTSSVLAQARPSLIMEREGRLEVPSLVKELSAIANRRRGFGFL